jgi:release factor glutamine methyltransferase
VKDKSDALRAEVRRLLEGGRVETSAREADWIVEHATGVAPVEPRGVALEIARRRAEGEPLQYLLGSQPFRHVEMKVGPGVFIPRPETEILAGSVVSSLPQGATVVDLCTGSGAIAAAVAHERPDARVLATELSSTAASYARQNLAPFDNAELFEGDLFHPLPKDLASDVSAVVANPPYVSPSEADRLPIDVVEHEPHQALFAEGEGSAVVSRIVSESLELLALGGSLGIEIGETQGSVVTQMFLEAGFEDVRVAQDLAGRDRIVHGRRPAPWSPLLQVVRTGGVVLIPTDTVFGLAASADMQAAVQRIFDLKGRPSEKALPVMVHNLEAVAAVARVTVASRRVAERFWPGPLTIVLERAPDFTADLGGADPSSVAVRIPNHPDLLRFLAASGPLAVTSANLSGGPPTRNSAEAREAFPELPLWEGAGGSGTASTVLSLVGEPRVLREGTVKWPDIKAALRS